MVKAMLHEIAVSALAMSGVVICGIMLIALAYGMLCFALPASLRLIERLIVEVERDRA